MAPRHVLDGFGAIRASWSALPRKNNVYRRRWDLEMSARARMGGAAPFEVVARACFEAAAALQVRRLGENAGLRSERRGLYCERQFLEPLIPEGPFMYSHRFCISGLRYVTSQLSNKQDFYDYRVSRNL